MTTKEIVKTLLKNHLIRQSVPVWAHRTVPYPFRKNGLPCLGFYFYPLQRKEGHQDILAPVVQLVVSYPQGNVVSISAAPSFYASPVEQKKVIGNYPNSILKGLSVKEGDKLYDEYYSACDLLLDGKDTELWRQKFNNVQEEGMAPFFALFDNNSKFAEKVEIKADAGKRGKSAGVSVRLKNVLDKVRSGVLNEECFAAERLAFENIVRNSRRDGYSFAVIGEFSRGKTTFLNNLFDFDLLPVGKIPTTAVLTKIKHSENPRAIFVSKDHTVNECLMAAETLEQFAADIDGRDPAGVLDIAVPAAWLENKNVSFYDTPGVGDFISSRAKLTLEAIDRCDCTIMTFSANQACSISEMEFFKANVILKATPKCVILITMLDTVKEVERMNVVNYIKEKLSCLVPGVEFWIHQNDIAGIEAGAVDAAGIEAIRKRINIICRSDSRAKEMRTFQLASRISMLLDSCRNSLADVEKIEKLSAEQRQRTIEELEKNKSRLELIVEKMINTGDKMEKALAAGIKKELDSYKENFDMDVQMSLRRTTHPGEWLEKEFPYLVRKTVKNICSAMEKKINFQILSDKQKLAGVLKKQLACEHLVLSLPSLSREDFDTNVDFKADDLEKSRLIMRCITAISVPVGIITFGPFATLISGTMAIASEFFMKKKIEEQKNMLSKYMQGKTGDIFCELNTVIEKYISQCYAGLIVSLRNASAAAIDEAVRKISDAENASDCCSVRADDLRREITNGKAEVDMILKTGFNWKVGTAQ